LPLISVEDNEFEINEVILDEKSNLGIWISEGTSKIFFHSVVSNYLFTNRNLYENFIPSKGNN
jgi:hypothetical protein